MKKIVILTLLSIFSFILLNCNNGVDSKVISTEQNYYQTLETKLSLLQTENDALILFKDGNEYKINFEKDLLTFYFEEPLKENKNARISSCSKSVGTEVCTGSGLSFARCSQGYVDGGCTLTVWKGRDGKYHAKVAEPQL